MNSLTVCSEKIRTNELIAVQPDGNISHSSDTDGATQALTVVVELNLRRSRHQGKVAAPRADLVKSDPDPVTRPNGKTDCGHQPSGGHAGNHGSNERLIGRNDGAFAAVLHNDLGGERHGHQRLLRRWVGVRDRAAHRPASPRGRVSDPWQDGGKQGQFLADQIAPFSDGLTGRCSDLQPFVALRNGGQLRESW